MTALHTAARDWQLTHGSLIKICIWDDEDNIRARPIGTSIFPTLFSKARFEEALQLQKDYNKLYAAVSEDDTWLAEILRDLLISDPFAKALWSVHLKAKEAGYIQPLSLGIFRSDYMLHQPSTSMASGLRLKQVEFNTMSCAGGTHANIVNMMHHHLATTGLYTTPPSPPNPIHRSALPTTCTVSNIISALATAHAAYGPPRNALATATAILMPVQPFNINICDERPLEYGLWALSPAVPCYRVNYPAIFLKRTTRAETGELLFYPPNSTEPVEVSVAYMRAGYEAAEHGDEGIAARIMIETSRAIKCPSVLGQLAGFKKVQQALAVPGVLERFMSDSHTDGGGMLERIRGTFAPMFPLDETEAGLWAREEAMKVETAGRYVLKPSLEGGGHNVYRGDIPEFLERTPEAEWRNWVLMEMIEPPKLQNVLLTIHGVHEGDVISELGVFGTCMWRKGEGGKAEMVENDQAGWSFKTKADHVDEMSVIKGYGCFDTPCLVEDLP